MSQWFSAAELDELKLPAIALQASNVVRQAHREGWQSRPREGRGGGREYYIGSLPEAARIELARRAISLSTSDAGLQHTLAASSEPCRPGTSSLGAGISAAFSTGSHPSSSGRAEKAVFLSSTVAGKRATARATARVTVVNLLNAFTDAGGLSAVLARQSFAHLFNASEIAVEPWVKSEVGKLSVRTLQRWQSQVVREGAERLAGKYGHRRGQGQIDGNPALRDFCIANMAANGHLTAKVLGDRIEARFGVSIPKRSIQRFMSTARIEHANAFLAAQNPDAWKNQRMVAFGSMSEGVKGPNDVWEADASPADIILLDPLSPTGQRRYHLVGNIDVWSRRAKVVVTETPRSSATLLVIRRCNVDWGAQTTQKTDNGKDFKSAQCVRAFADLGVAHKLCPPFTPEGKPHIERFFRTLQHDLIMTLPGFIGHSVADRKAIEAKRAFSDRLGHADELIEATLTKDELQAAIDDWLEHDYHVRLHDGLGTSPARKMLEWTGPIRRIENERALDMLLAEAPDTDGLRVVGKKGIRVENALFIAPELWPYVGDRVQVRLDPEDMGQIVVYSVEGDFICVAKCPERTGVDRREVAMVAKARQRAHQQELAKRQRDAKRDQRLGDVVEEVAALKREEARRVVNFPRAEATEIHSTPALAAAALAVAALRGEVEPPRPLSDEDRELAAEVMSAIQAEVIQMPVRAADEPDFSDDFTWTRWALAHFDELDDGQKIILAELLEDQAIQIRLANAGISLPRQSRRA